MGMLTIRISNAEALVSRMSPWVPKMENCL